MLNQQTLPARLKSFQFSHFSHPSSLLLRLSCMYKPPGQPLGLCGLRICISNKLRGDTDAKPRLRWLVLNFMVLEKLCGLPVNAQTQPPPRRNPDHVNQNSGSGTPAVAQPRLRIRAPRTVQGCWLTGKQSRCSHPAAVPSLTALGHWNFTAAAESLLRATCWHWPTLLWDVQERERS